MAGTHHKFLSLGLSAVGAYLAYKGLDWGMHQNSVLPIISAVLGSISVASGSIYTAIYTINGSESNSAESPSEWLSFSALRQISSNTLKQYRPFKGDVLSSEQKKINVIAEQFTQAMIAIETNVPSFYYWNKSHFEKIEYINLNSEMLDKFKDFLVSFYEKNFKKDLFMVKVLLYGQFQAAENQEKFANLFSFLWETHGEQFNSKDMKYLEQHINSPYFLENHLLKQEFLFEKLTPKMQEKLLAQAQKNNMDSYTYDRLFSIFEKTIAIIPQENSYLKDNGVSVKTDKIFEKISINSNIQEKLDTFEKRFESIYGKNETFNSIQDLFLVRENLSQFLTHFDTQGQYIEAKLFLDNDINRVLNSFHEEVNLLTKMKLTKHPKFNEKKDVVLGSMVERIYLVNEKMNEINQHLHEAIEQDLDSTIEVNQKVLKAKM